MDQLITYENLPLDEANTALKPEPLANKSFPYNDLADDRRFEEILYNLVGAKIKAGTFEGFDNISLMSGVREKGRDCALLRGGKNYGLIQCKKYKNNLSKKVLGEEITKFVLYSLLVPSLIADRNDFSYYIAVSTGFVLECSDFIDDFNTLIAGEKELNSWIAKNLRHPTLSPLKLDNIESEVRGILTKIKLLKILPQDLDGYLYEPACTHLQPLFFEVRVLIDNEPVEKLIREMRTFSTNYLNKEQLGIELTRGSFSLKHERNEFEEIPDSHILRQETSELLKWLESPVEKDKNGKNLNVCLLAGNAGMGKTVILKDLYDELTSKNVSVLGLKADKLYASSITELQEKIGLSIPIFQFVEQCKQKYQQVVLVVDQIDALSQAMSADRSFLNVYKSLIDNYTHDPNVRVIISVRIFDLHYDPSLRVYKNIKTVKVELLDENAVHRLLLKIGIKADEISTKLLRLLRVPNQLNIFARIAPSFSGSLGITNIQELYYELWRQKVITKPSTLTLKTQRIKQLLYKLVKHMFKTQRISVSEHHFEDFGPELSYLESERLLKKETGEIQFFHQTFYDFVFAKRFVEKRDDLITYIKSQEQSILIRSAVKMILNYLRGYDHEKYMRLMSGLTDDTETYYHIKHMLVSMLAFNEQPSEGEKHLFTKIVSQSVNLTSHFFEQTRSDEWFKVSISSGLLSFLQIEAEFNGKGFTDLAEDAEKQKLELGYHRHVARIFMSRFIQKQLPEAWCFLPTIKDQAFIRAILYDFNDWQLDRAYEILESCEDFVTVDPFGYFQILGKIAGVRPGYAWSKIKGPLLSESSDKSSDKDYEALQVLKELSKQIPEQMISTLSLIITKSLHWENTLNRPLVGDYTFTRVDLADSEDLYGPQYLYRLLAVCLKKAAKEGAKEFQAFLLKYKRSKHKAMLRLIVFSLYTNELEYTTEVYDLFIYLREIDHLKEGGDFSIEFRKLFGKTFPYFNSDQQAEVIDTLRNLVNKDEAFVFKSGAKPHRIHYWGRGKYAFLLKLPQETMAHDKTLKRQFQELARKFGSYHDKSSLGLVMAGIVHSPLSNEAYSKMSVEQWLNSFRKYNDDRDRFNPDLLKGGIEEHSNAFQDVARKRPADLIFSIIERAMAEKDIKIIYPIKGLWGLAETKVDQSRMISLFKRLLAVPEGKKEVRNLLYIAKLLVRNDQDDPELVDFLIEQSENYEDLKEVREASSGETQIGGLVTRGINTIHGSAAQALLFIQDPAMEERVFAALEELLQSGPRETRAALYFRFAYLNHLNRHRAYELFRSSLVKESDVYVIASSLWSLQFMGNYDFSGLKPVYDKLVLADNLGSDDTHWLFSILYFFYLFNKPGAEELLYRLLDQNVKSRSWALSEACKHFYFNEESAAKTRPLLMHLINKFANDANDPLQIKFLNIDHIKLSDIFDFIEAYINSKSFSFSSSLLSYLTQQCNSSPLECIKLFNCAILRVNLDGENMGHMRQDEDFTRFIVGAYTAIKGTDDISKHYRKTLLQSFNTILKDYRFRAKAEKILEELL
ncbi:ATP-binding protein [Pedobacter immunditicola]|uniref:ATP-binding protein n=1 Tax=Pedobacter immunditicola TaxID=3133440 RepID=UPI0030A04CEA